MIKSGTEPAPTPRAGTRSNERYTIIGVYTKVQVITYTIFSLQIRSGTVVIFYKMLTMSNSLQVGSQVVDKIVYK